MTLTTFIFLIALAFVVYQLAAIALNIRIIRRMREIRTRQQTQHSFGRLRHKLLDLAIRRELPSDSLTFLNFYLMHTFVMRNPDNYRKIAAGLQKYFLHDVHDTDTRSFIEQLNVEKKDWTAEVHQMVNGTGEATFLLIVAHTPFIRAIYSIMLLFRKVLFVLIKRETDLIIKSIRFIANWDSTNRTFAEANVQMRSLAQGR